MEEKLIKLIYDPKHGASNKAEFILKAKKIDGLADEYRNAKGIPSVKEMTASLTEFYNSHQSSQMFKPVKHEYNHITAPYYLYSVQMDLMDISNQATKNNNFNWILLFVDVYSRYAWGYLLKNKTAPVVNEAFKTWLKDIEAIPKNITCDNGSEFISHSFLKIIEENDIQMYYSRPDTHNQTAIIDRFIRTLRSKINKYCENYDTKVWYHVLPDLLYNYNHKDHKTLKTSPEDYKYEEHETYEPVKVDDYNVGDSVRYLLKKEIFDKAGAKWSKTIFKIDKIDGNRIFLEGKPDEQAYFLGRELQKINQSLDISNFGLERKKAPNDIEDKQEKAAKAPRNFPTKEEKAKDGVALTKEKRISKAPKRPYQNYLNV